MPKEAVRKREIKKNMRYIQSGRCKISCINTKLLTIQSLSRLSDLIKKRQNSTLCYLQESHFKLEVQFV